MHILCVASSGKDITIAVHEPDRGVCKGLADCIELGMYSSRAAIATIKVGTHIYRKSLPIAKLALHWP
jgi:hypothetical protein